jgi:phospholipid/cholesterol/gamma-HCH transport system substrate-binding protein
MKRSDTLTWSHVRTGVFIVAALLCAAAGIVIMGDKTKYFIPKEELSVIIGDVAGLKEGAPVWLSGVDVGVVADIHFRAPTQNNEVEVVLEIERDALKKVGQDSIITIKTRGLMGEKYVDITPSASFHSLPEKRVYGRPTPKLDDVLQKAGSAFDRLNAVVGKIDRGEGSLGRVIKDEQLYTNLTRLTVELRGITSSINRGEGTIGKLTKSSEPYDRMIAILNRAEATLQEIQSADGTMGRLVKDRQLYDKLVTLADKSTQAAEDVRELNRKLTSSDSTIGLLLTDRTLHDKGVDLMERAESSVIALEETIDKLNRGEGTAGKLISDRDAYDRLTLALESLDALLKDVKENPKRYVKFSLF